LSSTVKVHRKPVFAPIKHIVGRDEGYIGLKAVPVGKRVLIETVGGGDRVSRASVSSFSPSTLQDFAIALMELAEQVENG